MVNDFTVAVNNGFNVTFLYGYFIPKDVPILIDKNVLSLRILSFTHLSDILHKGCIPRCMFFCMRPFLCLEKSPKLNGNVLGAIFAKVF